MINKKLKRYISKDFTLHGDILIICQGDHVSAMALEAIISKTAYFIAQHKLDPHVIPWVEISTRDFEHYCLGLARHSSFGDRLKPGSLLHQLSFIESRYIDEDQGMPATRQFLLNVEAVKAALGALKDEDKPSWL